MDQLLIRHLVPSINLAFSGFVKHLSEKLNIDENSISEAIGSYIPNSNIPPVFKDLQTEIQAEMQSELDKKSNLKVGTYNISMGKYNSHIFLVWGQDTRNITSLLRDLGGRWKPVFCGKIYRVWQFNSGSETNSTQELLESEFNRVKREIENKTNANIRIDDRYYNLDQKCQPLMLPICKNIHYGPRDETVIKPSEIRMGEPSIKAKTQAPQINILKKVMTEDELSGKTGVSSGNETPTKQVKLGKVQKCKDGLYYAVDHGYLFKNIGTNSKKIKPYCIGCKRNKNDVTINKIIPDDVEKLDGWKIGYDQNMVLDITETHEEERDYPSSEGEDEEEESEYDEECSEGESDGEDID